MKRLFKPAPAIMLLLLSLTYICHTQNSYAGIPGNSGNGSIVSDTLLESNPRLKAGFSKSFPAALQQRWSKLDDGFYVSFLNNGRKSNAVFSKHGTINYVISDCTMEQLPEAFRDEIQKDYPGYQLKHGFEINVHNEVIYQVVLENAKQYVTLRSNGESSEKIQQVNK